jgi:GH15 family glucan-1,4-alpha-glucosidase
MSAPAPVDTAGLVASSLRLIVELQDPSGAYPASPTFSAYRGYSWFRDGAFIADAASAAGEVASAEAFFDWCSRVVLAERGRIEAIVAASSTDAPTPDDRMLPTRFRFDGTVGDDEWWDFQLDGYGTWLWALGDHLARTGGDGARWAEAAGLCVDYLASSWHRPCFDWWEEHVEQVHGSTLGCIAAGLRAAAAMPAIDATRRAAAASTAELALERLRDQGVVDGHLAKWVGDARVDGSLASLIGPIRIIPGDDPLAIATLERIEAELTVDGGVHRFVGDTFYGGGQWPLLSCMLGLAWLRAGRRDRAQELLAWAASTRTAEGLMPEQVDAHLLDPSRRQEWVDRWGPVATPLLWSHAMLVRLAVELDAEISR